MKVEIYTETSNALTTTKNGKYIALIVVPTNKGPATKAVLGEEKDTTANRMALLAILNGLEELTMKCEVTVYTPNSFVCNMIRQGNVEKWKREEWRRPQNKELKNKELWKRLDEVLQKQDVAVVHTGENKYTRQMKKWLEG